MAVRSRDHVAPVDERAAAEVGITSITLDEIKESYFPRYYEATEVVS